MIRREFAGHLHRCIRSSTIFSLTNTFVPGDVYSVTVGGVTTISTFTSYPGTFPLGLGLHFTYDAA